MYASPQDQIYAINGVPEIYVFFRNGGQTPADELRITGTMRAMADRPSNRDFELAPNIYVERSFLEPSAEIKGGRLVSHGSPLHPEVIQKLRDGKLQFYVWGQITYEDVFEDVHYTYFCFKYEGVYPSEDTLRSRFRDTCLHPKNR